MIVVKQCPVYYFLTSCVMGHFFMHDDLSAIESVWILKDLQYSAFLVYTLETI